MPISFGGHILDMMVPFQVMADFQPKVFCMVSPANSLTCEVIFSGRSFMYSRNKIGPRTEPWGTPDVTEVCCLFIDLSEIKCCHFSVTYS